MLLMFLDFDAVEAIGAIAIGYNIPIILKQGIAGKKDVNLLSCVLSSSLLV